jgi:site-specific DNA-methyltransferase (adenine-specific)
MYEEFNGSFVVKGDTLEVMATIPDKSIDMILCDLPYGTTDCKWDSVIPFDKLWEQYKRIRKPGSVVCLTASEPFTSFLVTSNASEFRHRWIWDKVKPSSGLNAKKAPLKVAEDVLIFCDSTPSYSPIMVPKKPRSEKKFDSKGEAFGGKAKVERFHDNKGFGYPKDILTISNADQRNRIHPTQKPVELFEYLIKTYSVEGAVVLDNTSGAGTTAIACLNLGRKFFCIERDQSYYNASLERIRQCLQN